LSDQNEAKKSQFQNFVNLIFWVILLFLKSVLSVIPTIMWVLSCAVSLAITRPWIEAFEGDQEFIIIGVFTITAVGIIWVFALSYQWLTNKFS
jgi:hypothetical protein